MKPVQRSLEKLRDEGWIACVVERWMPARGGMKFPRRIDAFGFGDILAMHPAKKKIALVQTTDYSSVSKHLTKIKELPEFKQWVDSGGIVFVHGWKGYQYVGDTRKTWSVRVLSTEKPA